MDRTEVITETEMENELESNIGNEVAPTPERCETFQLNSGVLVILDQFMVANRQLLIKLISSCPTVQDLTREGSELYPIVEMYGGAVLNLSPGNYRVLRDAGNSRIVICRSDSLGSANGEIGEEDGSLIDALINEKLGSQPEGRVLVDTRCLVLMDAELFASSDLLNDYRALRETEQEKKARDLLREHGAAVRYGFQRYGDELGVFILEENKVALWPDVIE